MQQRLNYADETEGRRLYRASAEAEARVSMVDMSRVHYPECDGLRLYRFCTHNPQWTEKRRG